MVAIQIITKEETFIVFKTSNNINNIIFDKCFSFRKDHAMLSHHPSKTETYIIFHTVWKVSKYRFFSGPYFPVSD